MDKEEKWIKIAGNIDEINFENNISRIQVNEKSVCILKSENGLKACSAKCPHAGGDLSAGFLDKRGNIICPIHNYRFNLHHGRDTNGEGYFLKIFQIKENESGIFLKM
ncbi:MAG TPA: Rieske 2Fe-2S domain-containing protein [Hanamia sp.]|jgi:nitrite reductase/ring-hydroxylating ferredoxin subunit|nr:Rieske 2Fe-2S domain-containing protein [Hanamia sp.]